jgi:hypothetical protein
MMSIPLFALQQYIRAWNKWTSVLLKDFQGSQALSFEAEAHLNNV